MIAEWISLAIEVDIIGFEQIGEDGQGTSSSSTPGDTDRLAHWLSSRHWLFGSSAEDIVSPRAAPWKLS